MRMASHRPCVAVSSSSAVAAASSSSTGPCTKRHLLFRSFVPTRCVGGIYFFVRIPACVWHESDANRCMTRSGSAEPHCTRMVMSIGLVSHAGNHGFRNKVRKTSTRGHPAQRAGPHSRSHTAVVGSVAPTRSRDSSCAE
jgi:hypothetical protein